jgi:release factor glutamine methyltransferase
MTIAGVLHEAVSVLGEAGSPTPRLDAEVLLAACLRIDRLQFYTHAEKEVTPEATEVYAGWLQRRIKGEPVAYIIGVKEFWSLPFQVTPAVLIPRPETEVLVEEALAVMSERPGTDWQVLDIGTGGGAIAVALAAEREDVQVTATDLSGEALSVAKVNAEQNGVKERIRFLRGDLFAPVTGQYDLIVSNPPYISHRDFDLLPPGIRNYEPAGALLAGEDGTEVHRNLIDRGAAFLKSGGWLLMEMGEDQGPKLKTYLNEHGGYDTVGIRSDYGGAERVAKARRK